ncbi:undecaprenyldiphospho-muramoylpentapeptide beta-N-acetylglucosaminyltransferase [Desulfobotulus sp. H1]|uniref:UDP-N-acetylglucosamine--N-acetylmuramyl-(pentapeptide) pyrophosphoryl-undecaprenol N-acetylglucosamine transferase n=1 Tax=Desulfobotulus pelophilus TaxID=2823377 RepID=A0ABT3N530_9BACT|nr:undecaprenyldiphospho-muramoylpentapeptide beta-N-acetylglucosaminyltransferase [Desulfobotulus pelophilus]MCW7752554.1 undecaprenyldiphospho-muramoylpentapeptide beta-N-acetylglucosaminyltransferase [Desulfobotulus pelophilus]
MNRKVQRLVISGGGTGGHLFPGVATAEEFLRRSPENSVLFINAGRPMDHKILNAHGFRHESIAISGIKGMGLLQKIKAALRFPMTVGRSSAILRSFQPQVLLSVGGYSAAPAALAAKLMRIPVIVHEQNSLPGLTTRLLARFATEVHVSFPDTQLSARPGKIHISGNPVRRDLVGCRTHRRQAGAPLRLLVLGGSQGARGLNQALCQTLPLIRNLPLTFVHQTGDTDFHEVHGAYAKAGVHAHIQPFIDDMVTAYAEADMVLSRAGATTVAELAAAGLGAIFIPFPHAADNHQFYNAKAMVDAGAAFILEESTFRPEELASILKNCSSSSEITEAMADAARNLSRPDAAITLTNAIMGCIAEE